MFFVGALDSNAFCVSKLCCAGELQPAVTVVLINNAGGGIFSFLPIADSLLPEVFTPLWATPQNVDLAGEHADEDAHTDCTLPDAWPV